MRLFFLVVVGVVGAAHAACDHRAEFEAFKARYHKTYQTNAAEEARCSVFAENQAIIAAINGDDHDEAVYGVGPFDRTDAEMRGKCGGGAPPPKHHRHHRKKTAHAWDGTCYVRPRFPAHCAANASTIPESFDWTARGPVTRVKNQGDCGNCFAFGGTGDMEAAHFLAGHDLVSLSEQQLTSCDRVGYDSGCGGGFSNLDTDRSATESGIAAEAGYPYCPGDASCKGGTSKKDRKNGVCNATAAGAVVARFAGGYQVSGGANGCVWCDKQPVDEERMKQHVFLAGPLTIGINSKFMDNYKRGIIHPPKHKCKDGSDDTDHQVLIVGYGVDKNIPYWKIKNSWGTEWGEKGFCRMFRGDNTCAVAADASHVVAAPIKKAPIRTLRGRPFPAADRT